MFVKTILLILLLPRFTHCRLRARWNQSFLINISLKWLQKRHTPKTLLHDLQGNAPLMQTVPACAAGIVQRY